MSNNPIPISKEQLKEKPLEEWSEEEREAAADLPHSVQLSYLTVRRLADTGSKTQTWDELVAGLIEEEQEVPA